MKKILKTICLVFILNSLAVFTPAQNSVNLTLGKKKIIKRVFQPATLKSKTVFTFYAAKNRTIEVKLKSNGVDLGDEYPCYLFFKIYDKQKKLITDGDYPEGGADIWTGKLTQTGTYNIEIFVSGIYSCDEKILKREKSKFSYTLEISLK